MKPPSGGFFFVPFGAISLLPLLGEKGAKGTRITSTTL
jgi:hypothetical protein